MKGTKHLGVRGAALLGGIMLAFLSLVALLAMGPQAALKMLGIGALGVAFFVWSEWREAHS